ncbi:hypothetical protein G7K_6697-t1 [Saitoella complicata NRRL Y-17804]|uniref:Uncharacterized protein n=1 Tax=Saitoella complicata (strain BCRC 22490 / CBS 7301 / JCM 7358 / NBRC 10748 / NRRL Y-17804) TaxID=698492 RepID=A0A0E9NRX3_SAICN|nr:hypothetical protein G7K_6697-t1 [Saitoella complicata NRRL Y-17804]
MMSFHMRTLTHALALLPALDVAFAQTPATILASPLPCEKSCRTVEGFKSRARAPEDHAASPEVFRGGCGQRGQRANNYLKAAREGFLLPVATSDVEDMQWEGQDREDEDMIGTQLVARLNRVTVAAQDVPAQDVPARGRQNTPPAVRGGMECLFHVEIYDYQRKSRNRKKMVGGVRVFLELLTFEYVVKCQKQTGVYDIMQGSLHEC